MISPWEGVPVGSSPLARGLRGGADAQERPVRIIPARAGFTQPTERFPRWQRDHPRSRGVYLDDVALTEAKLGSSPLARGLRVFSLGATD